MPRKIMTSFNNFIIRDEGEHCTHVRPYITQMSQWYNAELPNNSLIYSSYEHSQFYKYVSEVSTV